MTAQNPAVRHAAFLDEMGVGPLWVRRAVAASVPQLELAAAEMDWSQLKAAVSECNKCNLCAQRARTVFGVGGEKARPLSSSSTK